MKQLCAALLVVSLFLIGCDGGRTGDQTEHQTNNNTGDEDASLQLEMLLNDHFERSLELNPLSATAMGDDRYDDRLANNISPAYRESVRKLDEEALERLQRIDRAALDYQDQLSYDMFRILREQSLEGLQFPSHLQPVNQFYLFTSRFVRLGTGSGQHPFETVKNYDDFLSRIDDFVVKVDQAIENMKLGTQHDIVQPRVLIQKVVPQLTSQIVDDPEDSAFFTPIENLPDTFSEEDRQRLSDAYKLAIAEKIVPAFRRLNNFIGDEYLGASRDTVGLSDLPDGDDWYAYMVRLRTTTDMTPDEIHRIGLDEVARIHDEMRGVMRDVGFEGTLEEFFEYMYADPQFFFDEPKQLIQAYRDMSDDVAERAKALFDVSPKTQFEVRRVEPFRERSASKGSYQSGTPDGSRPGIFYANAYNVGVRPKWDMQSLFLHEAIPGHHFQISLQRESEDLPSFRRFGGFTAYVEGWGLYSESLGKELGMYQDPHDYFGALNAELWRSIRLVVDTGIHAKGWTRQQVLDYMFANSAVSETRAVAEAERFMAIPGQALAYKIGQLKIREIRNDAEERLGEKFDVRAFHTEILKDGSMPLSMLEAKIDAWVSAQL